VSEPEDQTGTRLGAAVAHAARCYLFIIFIFLGDAAADAGRCLMSLFYFFKILGAAVADTACF